MSCEVEGIWEFMWTEESHISSRKQYHQLHCDRYLPARTGFDYAINASQASPQVKALECSLGYHILILRRIRGLSLNQWLFSDRKPEQSLEWVFPMFLELTSLVFTAKKGYSDAEYVGWLSHSYSYLTF